MTKLNPLHVLLADDHAVVRKGIREFLEEDAEIVVVAEVSNGADAVRLVVGLAVGIAVFLLAARLGKMPELAEAVDMLRAVMKRSKREDKTA